METGVYHRIYVLVADTRSSIGAKNNATSKQKHLPSQVPSFNPQYSFTLYFVEGYGEK